MFSFLLTCYLKAQYNFIDAFPNLPDLNFPVDFQNSGDCTNRIFIIEKEGIIKVFENRQDVSEIKVFLDITDRVFINDIEMGLLGLTFHPDYSNNGYFYVNYTAGNPQRTVVSRFQVSEENPDSADEESEFEIISYLQPFHNHNGGWIKFGPEDGYFYISSGDGGPDGNGQLINTLLGKILRIDVDNPQPPLNYGIPPDNPFVDSAVNVRKEIYAWGLRNPWRCSFDLSTGKLWCGDVGASWKEEIDIIIKGGNYGWSCYEGNLPWAPGQCMDSLSLTFPVYDYPHSEGLSITGGYIYRGPNQPVLEGKYIYADWYSRKVWALEYDGINPPVNELLFTLPSGAFINSFGVDEANELYICGGSRIYKIEPTASIIAPTNLNVENTKNISQLTWVDNSDNEDGFIIERMTGLNNFKIISAVPANTTIFEDTILQTNDYQYRVKAYNSTDESGYSNIACISVTVVSVENDLAPSFNGYNLQQNYPNPFNPSTSIRFNIPEESKVKIEIVNSLGEVVSELVNGLRQSGFYNETWNAGNFSSGVYYVRMKAQSLVSDKNYYHTIKMLYLK